MLQEGEKDKKSVVVVVMGGEERGREVIAVE